jgi:zinc/manganese transport system substrate-binding protein
MKPYRIFLSVAVASILIAFANPATAEAEIKVVATLGDLAAAARQVGGPNVEVVTLASSREDPHYVDAKPSYIRELSEADLLVYNGMSLEVGWLPTLTESSRNGAIQSGSEGNFDASQFVERKGVPDVKIDRSMGDVHPEGNPHYTHAPGQMARVALGLAKRLGKIDGAHRSEYQKRARAFARRCLELKRKWKKKFASLPEKRRRATLYHEAWIYVLDWLGIEKATTIEPKPGVDPNPGHVAKVVQTMKQRGVPVILKMEYYPASVAHSIADKTGAKVLTSQGQTREGQSYVSRVDDFAASLYEAMKQ